MLASGPMARLSKNYLRTALKRWFISFWMSDVQPVQQVSLSAEGGDYESLLVNWLNEVLYYLDGKRIALWSFDISQLSERRIECMAAGEARDRQRHLPKVAVKAVTYHQLTVRGTEGSWTAEVYVDV
jgi:SHS2 domain-containing protein